MSKPRIRRQDILNLAAKHDLFPVEITAANGAAQLRGDLQRLEAFFHECLSRFHFHPRLITKETLDNKPTGKAPRIEIHPTIMNRA